MSVEVDPQAFDSSGRYKLGRPPPFGLFPPKSYFKAVCSCPECDASIVRLEKFEKDLWSKHEQVSSWFSFRSDVDLQITDLSSAVESSRFLLELLHYNLKGLGFPPKGNDSKLIKADLEITKKLKDARLMDNYDDDDVDSKSIFVASVHDEIKRVLYYYDNLMNTKVKVEACRLLNDILKIEVRHENFKKSAAENREKLNPLISKSYIVQQTELLEMLPVEELYPEVEEWIYKFFFLTMSWFKCSKADEEISDICHTMATISNPFWHTYLKNSKCLTGHDSTGLKDTLKNLCAKVDLFEGLWQEKYALLFRTPYEGSRTAKVSIWVKSFGPPPIVYPSLFPTDERLS